MFDHLKIREHICFRRTRCGTDLFLQAYKYFQGTRSKLAYASTYMRIPTRDASITYVSYMMYTALNIIFWNIIHINKKAIIDAGLKVNRKSSYSL